VRRRLDLYIRQSINELRTFFEKVNGSNDRRIKWEREDTSYENNKHGIQQKKLLLIARVI